MEKLLVINRMDNVGNAIEDIKAGEEVAYSIEDKRYVLKAEDDIPFGFKMAISDICKGQDVLKYGEPIGKASKDIKKGQLVHVHNLEGKRGRGDVYQEQ